MSLMRSAARPKVFQVMSLKGGQGYALRVGYTCPPAAQPVASLKLLVRGDPACGDDVCALSTFARNVEALLFERGLHVSAVNSSSICLRSGAAIPTRREPRSRRSATRLVRLTGCQRQCVLCRMRWPCLRWNGGEHGSEAGPPQPHGLIQMSMPRSCSRSSTLRSDSG